MGSDKENVKMAGNSMKDTAEKIRGVKRKKGAKAGLAGNPRKRSKVGSATSELVGLGDEIAKSSCQALEGQGGERERSGRMAPLLA